MIQPTPDRLDVVELMERIRAEAKRREAAGVTLEVIAGKDPLPLPPGQNIPAPPVIHVSDLKASQTREKFQGFLELAISKTEVDRWIPKPFRRLFRKQGGFNKAVVDALELVMKSQQRALSQTMQTADYLVAQAYWLSAVAEARRMERAWLSAIPLVVNDVTRELSSLQARIEQQSDDWEQLRTIVHATTKQLSRSVEDIQRTEARLTEACQGLAELREASARLHEDAGQRMISLSQEIKDLIEKRFGHVSKINESRFAALQAQSAAIRDEVTELGSGQERAAGNLGDLEENLAALTSESETSRGEISNLRSSYEGTQGNLNGLQQWREKMQATFDTLVAQVSARESETVALSDKLPPLQQRIDALAETVTSHQGATAASSEQLRQLQDAVNATALKLHELAEHVTTVERESEEQKGPRQALALDLEAVKASVKNVRGKLDWVDERQVSDANFIKAQLSRQETLFESLGSGAAGPNALERKAETSVEQSGVEKRRNDAFYLAFENRFRGRRSEIKRRMRVYLPFLKSVPYRKARTAFLDLGCGRGEWLELLRDLRYAKAAGVDSNVAMIKECRDRHLNVTNADAIALLAQSKKESVSVITSFHLIEHLTFSELMSMMVESYRVMTKGGLLIFETPNPRNILVGASDFYRDLTHRSPVHPDTIAFSLESVGFIGARCYFLADGSRGRTAVPQEDYRFDDLNAYVNVPRDYAVIATKA